jgi:hypothetical protein
MTEDELTMHWQTPRNYDETIDPPCVCSADSPWVNALVGLLVALAPAGCTAGSGPARNASEVECSEIAPGVELAVSGQAGPEARRIADEIRAKYAAELMTAHPAPTPRWPSR